VTIGNPSVLETNRPPGDGNADIDDFSKRAGDKQGANALGETPRRLSGDLR
jgi:hypothetical protein